MNNHSTYCSCNSCEAKGLSVKEKDLHIKASESGRREFLKTATGLGFNLGIGGGLISPLAAAALNHTDAGLKSAEMFGNKAVKSGKASIMTILHTADIHAQLLTHDEFFMENGKPLYKKRGGYATLKTMINELRNENPGNTILVDGGDCFQGSAVAALSKGKAIIPLMD